MAGEQHSIEAAIRSTVASSLSSFAQSLEQELMRVVQRHLTNCIERETLAQQKLREMRKLLAEYSAAAGRSLGDTQDYGGTHVSYSDLQRDALRSRPVRSSEQDTSSPQPISRQKDTPTIETAKRPQSSPAQPRQDQSHASIVRASPQQGLRNSLPRQGDQRLKLRVYEPKRPGASDGGNMSDVEFVTETAEKEAIPNKTHEAAAPGGSDNRATTHPLTSPPRDERPSQRIADTLRVRVKRGGWVLKRGNKLKRVAVGVSQGSSPFATRAARLSVSSESKAATPPRQPASRTDCSQCRDFYTAICDDASSSSRRTCAAYAPVLQSKHRYFRLPAATPKGYWDIDFPKTQARTDED